jgi:hypothetical protein
MTGATAALWELINPRPNEVFLWKFERALLLVFLNLHPSTGDEPDHDHDHDDNQNYVNQGSANMERETEKPQYEQDYSDSPKHGFHGTVGAAI